MKQRLIAAAAILGGLLIVYLMFRLIVGRGSSHRSGDDPTPKIRLLIG